jgi:PAS domain S-box-containing protein/putative nucleotidyltransferase with HDIG domain
MLGAFGVVVLLLLVVGLIAITRLGGDNRQLSTLASKVVPGTRAVGEINALMNKYRKDQLIYVYSKPAERLTNDLAPDLALMQHYLSTYRSQGLIRNPAERRLLDSFEATFARYVALTAAFRPLADQGQIFQASQAVGSGRGDTENDRLKAVVGAWSNQEVKIARAAETASSASYSVSVALILVLLGVAVAIAVAVALVLTRSTSRAMDEVIARNFDLSLDLLGTADLNGRFTHVNPAWERLLGHTAETMCSHPFIEFVHPEDREATTAEAAALAEGSRDTIGFRNRYRAADGTYRLIEWTAHGSPSEGVIHVVGRDIRLQQEAEEQLADNAQLLEGMVAERTRELEDARAETLHRLAVVAEYRDDNTFQHTERVGTTSVEIAARLGLSAEEIEVLREAAPLHDVGKIAIPDRILFKPGKLSDEEYELMKTHATLGARLLSGSGSPVLQMATVIAESHHERWDGTGYPNGLAGRSIPLVGRIVAVADVFDALIQERPYKPAWPYERALAEIRDGSGTQFDPNVVAAFLATDLDFEMRDGSLRQGRHPVRQRRRSQPRHVPLR